MSLIIYKPADKKISKQVLEKCYANDADGIGFCFAEDGKIFVKKVFKNFESFYEEFLPHENKSCVLNFVTNEFVGCKRNCGPFVINENDKNFVLAHTGIVWKKNIIEKPEESQTSNLIRLIKKMFFPAAFGKDYLKWLIEEALPLDNRVIIFNNLGEVQIFNKNKGLVIQDCWFSDTPYKSSSSYESRGYSFLKECCICKNKFSHTIQIGTLVYCPKCNVRKNSLSGSNTGQNFPVLQQGARPNERIPEYLKVRGAKVNEFLQGLVNPVECVDVFDVI